MPITPKQVVGMCGGVKNHPSKMDLHAFVCTVRRHNHFLGNAELLFRFYAEPA